uniref:Uncharacterized protein n=1 Tax=Meloidogyne enterolobii TaxID=390850 RepID=A0A6V7VL59_MELEN|nr:unnamed protein product [Meloidogyne enterolobii]
MFINICIYFKNTFIKRYFLEIFFVFLFKQHKINTKIPSNQSIFGKKNIFYCNEKRKFSKNFIQIYFILFIFINYVEPQNNTDEIISLPGLKFKPNFKQYSAGL